MDAAGVQDKVRQLAAAADAIEEYRAHLAGSAEPAKRAVDLVKAVGG